MIVGIDCHQPSQDLDFWTQARGVVPMFRQFFQRRKGGRNQCSRHGTGLGHGRADPQKSRLCWASPAPFVIMRCYYDVGGHDCHGDGDDGRSGEVGEV